MEIGYLQEVKAVIKSLVVSCPNAITIDELNLDYRSIEGQRIPYQKLGFQTLESFLRSIPDTVNVSIGYIMLLRKNFLFYFLFPGLRKWAFCFSWYCS